MSEVGLGIGRAIQPVGGIELEVLLWHDEQQQPYPVPEEELRQVKSQMKQLQQRAETAERRMERLVEYLKSQGLDPDNLPEE